MDWLSVLGRANPYKEADATQGIAASTEEERSQARNILANTRVAELRDALRQIAALDDQLNAYLELDLSHQIENLLNQAYQQDIDLSPSRIVDYVTEWLSTATLGQLKHYLLSLVSFPADDLPLQPEMLLRLPQTMPLAQKFVFPLLHSDIIAAVVKLMDDPELVALSKK